MKRGLRSIITAALAASLATVAPDWASASTHYAQKNLVSNDRSKIPAAHEDTTLLNPWGVAFFPGSPFWINDNGSGVSALYQGTGAGFGGADPALAVTIPPPKGGTPPSAPTGIVANSSFAFNLKDSNPALFIFDTEDGTISAWNLGDGLPSSTSPPVAELTVDNSKKHCTNGATGAVYKGLALGTNIAGVFLYATNFRCASVDVFDTSFKPATLRGHFQDADIPDDFAPFGIANIGGNLVITYAKQNAQKHDDEAGPGRGFVDIFDTNGNLIERFAAGGVLNSPWGIAQAPFNFGRFSNDLLIGNFGDGTINGFVTNNHFFVGKLLNTSNKPIVIDGLWSLVFGGAFKSDPGILYFTAGPDHESDGLFGSLTPQ
jgi:uncharacterized protein (TIGR03118 family)